MVDASIVPAPEQAPSQPENAILQRGAMTAEGSWSMPRQKMYKHALPRSTARFILASSSSAAWTDAAG